MKTKTKTPRALTPRAAAECESAIGGRCRCRCKGTLHGAQRSSDEVRPSDQHAPAFFCPACKQRTTPAGLMMTIDSLRRGKRHKAGISKKTTKAKARKK